MRSFPVLVFDVILGIFPLLPDKWFANVGLRIQIWMILEGGFSILDGWTSVVFRRIPAVTSVRVPVLIHIIGTGGKIGWNTLYLLLLLNFSGISALNNAGCRCPTILVKGREKRTGEKLKVSQIVVHNCRLRYTIRNNLNTPSKDFWLGPKSTSHDQ